MAGFNLPLVNPALGAPPAPSSMPSMPSLPVGLPASPLGTARPPVPAQPAAAPMVPSPSGGMSDVLKQLLPVLLSGIAAKRGGAMAGSAVLNGYAQGLAKKHQDELEHQQMVAKLDASNLDAQQNAAKLTQERQFKLSQFITDVTKQVNDIDDPATFAATVDLADQTAQQAFGAAPGLIKRTLVFNDAKRLEKEKKAAKETVEAFLKAHPGVTLDDALAANVMIGSKKLSDLAALINYEPAKLPSGELFTTEPDVSPVASEKDVAAQAVADAKKAARMAGKPFTQTDATRVSQQAIKQFKEATRLSPQVSTSAAGSGASGSDAESIADAIMRGEQPPTLTGLYRVGGTVRAILGRKGYDLTRAQQDFNATTRMLSTLNGPQQVRLRQAAQTAYDSLDIIEDLNRKLTPLIPRSRFPAMNRIALAAAKGGALGLAAQTIATQLEAQITDLTSELANVYMGGNSPTEQALRLAAHNLNSQWTETQLKDTVALARKNLQIRLNSIGLAAPIGGRNENPYAPEVPPPSGRDAGAGSGPSTSGAPPKNPKPGDTWLSPTGPTVWGADAAGRLGWHPVK